MEHPSNGNGVESVVHKNPIDGKITIKGRIVALGNVPQTIIWEAAAGSTRGIGFAGSGLPFPNKDVAIENTPNKGTIQSQDGSFLIQLTGMPNGYYSGLGSVYVPPVVELYSSTSNGKQFKTAILINDVATPYRWISGAPASLRPQMDTEDSSGRSMYYSGREDIPLFRNQEALLRATGYPANTTVNEFPQAVDAHPWKHVPAPI
jgi:hypothetical protein